MKARLFTPIAVVGASALIVAGAAAAMVVQGPADSDAVAGEMSTGVTVTNGPAVSAVSVTRAAPAITGPAPLPKEEQGLPG